MGDWKISTNPDYTEKNGKRTYVAEKITRSIGSFLVHPNYTATNRPGERVDGETQRNDIALIRLNESVPLYQDVPTQSFANPICLPWSDYLEDNHPARNIKNFKNDKKDRTEMVVTGWGKTKEKQSVQDVLDNSVFVDILQRAKVPVTNDIPNCAAFNPLIIMRDKPKN